MKKRILTIALCVLAVISFSAFAASCSKTETPPLVAGEDTVVTSTRKTAKDLDAETAVFAALGKLESYTTYQTESSGKAVAKKGFINYTQNTKAKACKRGDEFYSDTVSESSLVKLKHEAFRKGEGVAYRVSGGDIINTRLSDYTEVYGVTPAKLLSGHIFNQETIVSATLISSENGLYTYSLVLEKDGANALLKKQMKMFGNLGGYPAFKESTKATLVVKEDLTPVSYSYESKYSISVAVLGSMDCVETNEIKFDNFNGEVNIPDTEKFNAALGTTPSKVEASKDAVRSETEEKIISALLDLDMENGVSLVGTLNADETSVPVKIQLAADVVGMLDGDVLPRDGITAKLSLFLNDDLSVLYYNNKLYLSAFGNKLVFNAPEDGEFAALLTALFGNGEGIEKYVSFSQSRNYYTITATSYAKNILKIAVAESFASNPELMEKISDVIDGTDINLSFYIPNETLSGVSLDIASQDFNAGADFVIANEELVVGDLSEYGSKATAELTANVAINEKLHADVTANVIYDTLEEDPQKALSAEVTAVLDNNIKSMLSMSNLLSGLELPDWFSTVGSADTVKYIIKDGKTYFLLFKGGVEAENAILATEGELPPVGELDFGAANFGAILEVLGMAKDTDSSVILALVTNLFTVNAENGVINIALADEVVTFVQENFWAYVPEKLFNNVAATMITAVNMFELYRPLAGMGLEIDVTSGAVTLYADVYKVVSKEVFISDKEYETARMLSATFTATSGEDFEITTDLYAVSKNAAAANAVIEEIKALGDVELTEEYLARLEAAKADYEALTDAQKQLVYNYQTKVNILKTEVTFNYLKSQYDTYKKNADNFVKNVTNAEDSKILSNRTTYDNFSETQKEYLDRTYAEEVEKFKARRAELEADLAPQIEEKIEAIEDADVYSMSLEEIYARLNALNTIYKDYVKFEKGVIENEQKLLSAIEETAEAYATIVRSAAEDYMETLKNMSVNYCEFSVSEMNELYAKTTAIYTTYYTRAKSLKVYSFVQEKDPTLDAATYTPCYYTQYVGTGFRSGAAYAANAAIDELLGGSFTAEEAAPIVEEIKTLIGRTDKNAITRYEEFTEYAEKLA